jgi:hypothetical protein
VADQLATAAQLNLALGEEIDASTAAVWLNAATAVVQEAAGQRIARVLGDVITLTGTTDSWLQLPQIPVTAVTAVLLDGEALTAGQAGASAETYRLRGSRLWRGCGWQQYQGEPSEVTVTCDHGYADGDQELELARSAVLGLAKRGYTSGDGVTREAIDDYQVAYEASASTMDTSPHLKRALRRQYGLRAALVRIG